MPAFNPNTVCVYRGPSELDSAPIIVLVSGLTETSDNTKTGDMLQTWILHSDVDPVTAVRDGRDVSICGDCVHRGAQSGDRTCYVEYGRAPLAMYGAFKRGRYRDVTDHEEISQLARGRVVRFGSYGDPAAAPLYVWQSLFALATADNGYTHQWKDPRFLPLRQWCMASCDSAADYQAATMGGWRTYRVRAATDPLFANERPCPASKELGEITTCQACRGCGGLGAKTSVNRSIIGHGSAAIVNRLAARIAA